MPWLGYTLHFFLDYVPDMMSKCKARLLTLQIRYSLDFVVSAIFDL